MVQSKAVILTCSTIKMFQFFNKKIEKSIFSVGKIYFSVKKFHFSIKKFHFPTKKFQYSAKKFATVSQKIKSNIKKMKKATKKKKIGTLMILFAKSLNDTFITDCRNVRGKYCRLMKK